MKLIDSHIKNIVTLCKRYKVNRLFVVGSVLTDRFNDDSDIDLVVDFKKDEAEDYFDNYFDFKYSLQDLRRRNFIFNPTSTYAKCVSNREQNRHGGNLFGDTNLLNIPALFPEKFGMDLVGALSGYR